MASEPEDIDFIKTKFHEVEGWCLDESAYLTLWLMQAQTEAGLDSSILEIGVYKGKYLSVLYQQAKRTSQSVVGIDTFAGSSKDEVISTFVRLFGSAERLSLVTHDSTCLNASEVRGMLGGKKASFISVDGDHSARAVQSDLVLSKSLLSNGGIVSVDDFLNPYAIGVSEGFYRFMIETGEQSLRPFAYCANKLFCAEQPYHDFYTKAVWTFVEQMPGLPQCQEVNRRLQSGRQYVEYDLLGSKTLVF